MSWVWIVRGVLRSAHDSPRSMCCTHKNEAATGWGKGFSGGHKGHRRGRGRHTGQWSGFLSLRTDVPCVEKLRTVLPFTVGIRDGAVQLVLTLRGGGGQDTAIKKLRIVRLRVWHVLIENGYGMMEKSKTPHLKVR